MSRARPPTDERRTEIYDPSRPPGGGRAGARVEIATPTELAPPRLPPPPSVPGVPAAPGARAVEQATPTEVSPPYERSEPLRVISMKAPGRDGREDTPLPERPARHHEVRLRPLAEVARRHAATPPGGLGYLAPPRDPRQARTRRWRDYAIWGSLAVILACAITICVWLLAAR